MLLMCKVDHLIFGTMLYSRTALLILGQILVSHQLPTYHCAYHIGNYYYYYCN